MVVDLEKGSSMKYFLMFALIISSFVALASNKVLYGDDNRTDVYASENPLWRELALSTAAMIQTQDLRSSDRDGFLDLNGPSLESRGMCSSERFLSQPTAAFCSGFLVGEDLLVTAGHCIRSVSDCDKFRWVFDYKMEDEENINLEIPKENVFKCVEVVSRALNSWGDKNDYALVRLDRAVEGRPVLKYRKKTDVAPEEGDHLVVIGHPTGLPTKIADGAAIRKLMSPVYLTANLDTYGGNSGSAVFNAESGVVEGILVRGETDYVYENSCRVSKQCSDTGCRGEDVTRITVIPELE